MPVASVHVGCIMVSTTGADGESDWVFITTLAEASDTQFEALLTVKL
jgi:hypothetical protein